MARTELAPPDRAEHIQATGATAAKSIGPFVHHVTPAGRDVRYDAASGEAALPVTVHFRDGSTANGNLVLAPGQVLLFAMQMERAVDLRAKALGKA